MNAATGTLADAARLLDLITARWMTQAVGVAAELRVADALAGGANDIASLAKATSCEAAALHRLMRALTNLGICTERADGTFEITPMGELLKSDTLPSLRSWAIWIARYQWGPWGELLHSVRTGQSARALVTGKSGYGFVENDPTAACVFNRAMVEQTQLIAGTVAGALDLSAARRLVDVGGGHGELLAAILAQHPGLHGTVFDLPHAAEGAGALAAAAGLASRFDFISGSFFESVPAGGDAYLLKSILHNWDDERCKVILGHCRRAMAPGARLLIVERVMPERITGCDAEKDVIRGDLNMLVGLGGRERTLAEFGSLLAQVGLETGRSAAITLGYGLIESVPAR